MPEIHARLFVIAAPSGAGKTTLVRALITHNPDLRFSISYTTREKRSNEAEGVDYLFVDTKKFAALRVEGELLESATVFDHLYATSRSQVDQHLQDGHSVVLEIDWQGARQVRESMPDCVTVFILPPSLPELERRLRDRRTDSDDVIARRLAEAASEMERWEEFDYVVINDELDRAVTELEAILAGEGESQATQNTGIRARITDITGL